MVDTDALASIDGVKPKRYLADGEEAEVKGSGKNPYKLKRTDDHYHCTCPAWRNQKTPTDARTCKHLKELLGENYEEARLDWKNGGISQPAGQSKTNAKTTAKAPAKRKAKAEPDEDEAEQDEAEEKPAAKPRSTRPTRGSKAAPASKNQDTASKPASKKPPSKRATKSKAAASEDESERPAKRARTTKASLEEVKEEEDAVMDDVAEPDAAVVDGDEMADIDGVKPKKYLKDGDEAEVAGSGKNPYKCKRTWDHYYCSCPAWRNQKGVRTEMRTCKHLRGLLGDAYEDARIARKQAQEEAGTSTKPESKATAPASKAKAPTSKSKAPTSKAKAPASKSKPTSSKVKSEAKEEDISEVDEEEQDEEAKEEAAEEDVEMENGESVPSNEDELAEIDGVKPKRYLPDGEEIEAKSMTSSAVYKVKRTFDHYYCTCPAWRNQARVPVDARSCKHLREILGDAYEDARMKWRNPDGQIPAGSQKKAAAKKKVKKGDDEDDEDDDGDDGAKVKVEILLATKWDLESGADPTGWWMSEKLDGVRVYWDGNQMLSRLGNPFTPPQWFKDKLPKDIHLDGELFGGRGEFQSTVSIVKTSNSPRWKDITFQVFDVPSMGNKAFEERIDFARKIFGKGGEYASMERIKVLPQEEVRDRQHVLDKLKEIETVGGEGVMLRKPKSLYERKRSNTLMKVKTFYDAEAEVIGYEPGKGKHKGLTGSLKCKMESGKMFNVGTGLSDAQRRKPPKVGAIVVYRFQELTKDGVPRFPSYLGEAADKKKAKDAAVPDHKKTNTSKAD